MIALLGMLIGSGFLSARISLRSRTNVLNTETNVTSSGCEGNVGAYESCIGSWGTKCCPGGHRCRSESHNFEKDCNVMWDSSCKCYPEVSPESGCLDHGWGTA